MWNILSKLQKNLVWAIPISMSAGLFWGYFFNATPLKRFIIPVTFVMVYPMMVTLNVKSIFKGRDTRLQLTTQVINFAVIPLMAYLIGRVFFAGGLEKHALWAVGLFLIGVLPTSGMTISWTGFARGNKEAAIKMVVFGLVIGSLAAPVFTKVFMGATVEVNMLHMFKQIALFVFVPLFAGLSTQYAIKRKYGEKQWQQRIKPKFPPFSALGVILIAFVAMSLKARNIIANPGDILVILVPLAVFYLFSYGMLTVVGRLFFKREDAVAMVFGVVMRDLSIALAIAMTAFGRQGTTIALLIALAYVIQIQSAAWYIKLVDRLFGKVPDVAGPALVQQKRSLAVETRDSALPVDGSAMVPEIKKILYATDLSDTARHAVKYACSLGNRYGAEVTVLHVIPDLLEEFSTGAGFDLMEHVGRREWDTFNRNSIAKARDAIRNRIRETSRQVTRELPVCPLTMENIDVKVGSPVEQIVQSAEQGGFDLVVMGIHGHGKLEEALVGNVTAGVLRRCSVPVMVVRLPKTEAGSLTGSGHPAAGKPNPPVSMAG